MGIVIRQGIKSALVSYAGVLIGALNLLYFFPKFLSAEEIGLTRVLVDAALVLAGLSQFGTINITERFFPYFNDHDKKHNGFFLLILAIPFLGFLLISLVFLLLKDPWVQVYQSRSALFNEYYVYILPLAFFIMYQQVLEAYCRVHLRIVVPAFVKEFFLRIFLTAAVLLLHFKFIGLHGLINALLISYCFAGLILVVYIWQLRKLFCDLSLWSTQLLSKEVLVYGGVIFATNLTGLIASKIDILILSAHSGLVFTGVYSIAFFIGTVIDIPRRSVALITVPLVSQAWKDKDFVGMGRLYKRTALNMTLIGCVLFMLIWFNLDFIFSWMPNGLLYKSGTLVILLIAICRLLEMVTGINGEIILNSPYYRFNLYFSIVSSVIIILSNYFLITAYGMNGAAMAVLINFIFYNLFKMIFIWNKLKIHPFSVGVAKVLIVSGLTYASVYLYDLYFTQLHGLLETIGRTILIVLLYGVLTLLLQVSEEVQAIFEKLRKIRF